MSIRKICLLAMFMAMAVVVNVLESFIPSIVIPGIKLGLANIFILLILYEFSIIEALLVNLGRVFISSLIRGTIFQMGFFMSLCGALLSMFVMWMLIKIFKKKLTPIAISVVGSIFHIFGQFVIGTIFLSNPNIWYYAPILLLTSLLSGILVGVITILILRTNVIEKMKNKYNM